MEHFRLNNITIEYFEELSLAVLTYDCKFIKHEEYLKVNEAYFRLLVEKKCTRCMYDLTNMGLIPAQSLQWSTEEFIPRLNSTHLQFMATIYSKDIFNKIAVNNLASKVKNTPYVSQNFSSKAEAMDWLKSQREQKIAS